MDLDLIVTILSSPTDSAEGDILDLSLLSATVRFDDPMPALAIGDEVAVLLESPRLDRPYELDAEVTARTEGRGSGRIYEFSFLHAHRVGRILDLVFERLFNRRSASRVYPRNDREIAAKLKALHGESWIDAEVLNISRTGVGLSLPVRVDADLVREEVFLVYLRLPGEEQVVLESRVRSRRRLRDDLVYGIAFERTPDTDAYREQIETYVQIRRAERALEMSLG